MMKALLLMGSLLASTATFASTTFTCSTAPELKPHDTFIIKVKKNTATVRYERHAFFGSEEMSFIKSVEGCVSAQYVENTPNMVYIECDGDGDAGFIKLNTWGNKAIGSISFPEGNIGYPEDTQLKLTCLKK